jgi:hypothetical protein
VGPLEKRVTAEVGILELQCDPGFWGEDAEETVREWLLVNYDRARMPTLTVVTLRDKPGYWLLGWDVKGTHWPPLLELIFGAAYAEHRLMLNKLSLGISEAIAKHGSGQYGASTDRRDRR